MRLSPLRLSEPNPAVVLAVDNVLHSHQVSAPDLLSARRSTIRLMVPDQRLEQPALFYPGRPVPPQSRVTINRQHPLARDLAIAVLGSQPRELVHGFPLNFINDATTVIDAHGQVFSTLPDVNAAIEIVGSGDLNVADGQPMTIYALVYMDSASNADTRGAIISKRDNADVNWHYTVPTDDTGQPELAIGSTDDGATLSGPSIFNAWVGCGVTWNGGAVVTHYQNGAQVRSSSAFAASDPVQHSSPISIGCRWGGYPGPSYTADMLGAVFFIWYGRALSALEMQQLHFNRYQFLKPV